MTRVHRRAPGLNNGVLCQLPPPTARESILNPAVVKLVNTVCIGDLPEFSYVEDRSGPHRFTFRTSPWNIVTAIHRKRPNLSTRTDATLIFLLRVQAPLGCVFARIALF